MNFNELRVDSIATVIRYKSEPGKFSASNRKNHIIGINISGRADHDLGYTHLNLKPDYIYFFNQRDDFSAQTVEVGYCYSVHFTTTEPIETDSFCKKVNNTDEFIRLIAKVESAWLQSGNGELSMLCAFYGVCDALWRMYTVPYTRGDERIHAAKAHIDLHFKEKGCIQTAADIYGVSARRFRDIFSLRYGMPPGEYVLKKKIAYAKELFDIGNISVENVAELSGFCDAYYFSRMFKKLTGITPGKYKRNG